MSNVLEFVTPSSGHIRRLTYDPDEQLLTVLFTNNWKYTHSGVPRNVFSAMTRWSSPGAYYHSVIKRHYRIVDKTEVRPEEKPAGER